METIYPFIVIIHIIAGTILVAFSSIMQLVVGPAVKKLSAGDDKSKFLIQLKKRRIPVMDGAIIIQILTALFLFHSRHEVIFQSSLMGIKALAGGLALILAFVAHFYIRGKKEKADKTGNKALSEKLSGYGLWIEKTVLIGGSIAFFSGIIFNHFFGV